MTPSQKQSHSRQGILYGIIAVLAVLVLIQTALLVFSRSDETDRIRSRETAQNVKPDPSPQHTKTAASDASLDPVDELENFQSRINQFFNTVRTHGRPFLQEVGMMNEFDFFPATDLRDTEDAYIISLDLPGLERDLIQVKVQGQTVTIRGERQREETLTDPDDGFYSQERQYGTFSRMIPLPGPVIDTQVSAKYDNGVLTVTLPKDKTAASVKKIAVE